MSEEEDREIIAQEKISDEVLEEEHIEVEKINAKMDESIRILNEATVKNNLVLAKIAESEARTSMGGRSEAGAPPIKISDEERIKKSCQEMFPADLLPLNLR